MHCKLASIDFLLDMLIKADGHLVKSGFQIDSWRERELSAIDSSVFEKFHRALGIKMSTSLVLLSSSHQRALCLHFPLEKDYTGSVVIKRTNSILPIASLRADRISLDDALT